MPHWNRGIHEPVEQKLERFSMPIPECGCFAWIGGTDGQYGYGRIKYFNGEKFVTENPARVAYRIAKGPIPQGLEIDHLCFSPWCINPDHLEPVTPLENNRRRQHSRICRKGHSMDQLSGGKYVCRICRRERQRR
jgi:hypothetical protein